MDTLWLVRLTIDGRMLTQVVAEISQADARIQVQQMFPGAQITEARPLNS